MTCCKHGTIMASDSDWEECDTEFYKACDCCGSPIHKESHGSYFEGDPNRSRLLCVGCRPRYQEAHNA